MVTESSTEANGTATALPPLSERFRERLNQEHFLVVQRVSWLLVSQSFLFIVYTALVVAI